MRWRRLHGARALHFYKWLGTVRPPWVEEQQTRADQTVLTSTKSLTKTTNCAFTAKKWRGTIKVSAGSVPPLPTFAQDWCPSTFKFIPQCMPHPFSGPRCRSVSRKFFHQLVYLPHVVCFEVKCTRSIFGRRSPWHSPTFYVGSRLVGVGILSICSFDFEPPTSFWNFQKPLSDKLFVNGK